MPQIGLFIDTRDPLNEEALSLLCEAALEARRLYSDSIDPGAPKPTTASPSDIYLIAFSDGNPVSCRALRKLDDSTAELRRMYILSQARRTGIDRGISVRLEEKACRLGYETLLLETGN